MTVAALFVETDGTYFGLPDVDPWDIERDARTYPGPHPVVAHPPCQRWGRFWHGGPSAPHRYKLGDDSGCFAAALTAVRNWSSVLEHPAHSNAWDYFGLMSPRPSGWSRADNYGGWTCQVEQCFYGHAARKPTWLYVVGCLPPPLRWGEGEQRLDPVMVERYGYEKSRRQGIVSMIGGKDKVKIRNATPPEFRDALLDISRMCIASAERMA